MCMYICIYLHVDTEWYLNISEAHIVVILSELHIMDMQSATTKLQQVERPGAQSCWLMKACWLLKRLYLRTRARELRELRKKRPVSKNQDEQRETGTG